MSVDPRNNITQKPCYNGIYQDKGIVGRPGICIAAYTGYKQDVKDGSYCINDTRQPIYNVFFGVTRGGNDDWVSWITTESPIAHLYDKTPLVINGHDIHSLEFRQRYGLIFTTAECKAWTARKLFALLKAFRVGWTGECNSNLRLFFALRQRGVSDKVAFRIMLSLGMGSAGMIDQQRIYGGHNHFAASDLLVDGFFGGKLDESNSFTVFENKAARGGYSSVYSGVDSVYSSEGMDPRDLKSELKAMFPGTITKSRFGAVIDSSMTLDNVVTFANTYTFKPTTRRGYGYDEDMDREPDEDDDDDNYDAEDDYEPADDDDDDY